MSKEETHVGAESDYLHRAARGCFETLLLPDLSSLSSRHHRGQAAQTEGGHLAKNILRKSRDVPTLSMSNIHSMDMAKLIDLIHWHHGIKNVDTPFLSWA